MKNNLFTLALIAFVTLCFTTVNAQTIRRVNNTPGLNDPNVYATAQAAHDAAAANDIISLEPSASPSYGNVTVTKRINIVGTGYLLEKNPNNTFDKRQTTIDNLIFENGSANSTISGVQSNGTITIYDANVTISRCQVSSISHGRSSTFLAGIQSVGNNSIIVNNFISSGVLGTIYSSTCGGSPCSLYSGTNCTIANNIINSSISTLSSSVINYNTFYYTIGSSISNVVGSTVTNNIFDARSATISYQVLAANSSGTTASNNICLGVNGLPTGGGNVNGANPNTTFVGTSTPQTTYQTNGDKDFQLAVGSPALTAAVGGTQAGAFGNGANAYRLSGVPATPIITSFISTGAGNNTTPLSVTISVRSNN